MATTPRKALQSFRRMDQQKKDDDKIRYQYKVALIVARALELDEAAVTREYYSVKEADPDLFMAAIKGISSGAFPANLFIEKGPAAKFDDIAIRAHESYWFNRFLAIVSEGELAYAGVVFPMRGRKNWILHNMPISPLAGKVRLIIPSGSEEVDGIHVTPLGQFLEEYK